MGYSRDVLKGSGNVITTRDLTKYYGPVRAIDSLNLQVRQGEVFGFLGPNGAGKTTTTRILLDMVRVFLVTLQGFLAIISIAAYSLLLSTLFLDPRKAVAVAGGLTAALYILKLLGPALHSLGWLQKLSIFYYFQPLEIMLRGSFAPSSVLVYVGVTALCFAAALVVFQRRKAVV